MDEFTMLPKRKSIRLHGFDYSTRGYYFITVVTQNRICRFGDIVADKMVVNDAGAIVASCCRVIAQKFTDAETLDFTVMPNHFHCILGLTQEGKSSIPDIMRWFKSITTNKYIHGVREKNWMPFDRRLWQDRYYDHFIRDQHEFDLVRDYILNNPARWNADSINPVCDPGAGTSDWQR